MATRTIQIQQIFSLHNGNGNNNNNKNYQYKEEKEKSSWPLTGSASGVVW